MSGDERRVRKKGGWGQQVVKLSLIMACQVGYWSLGVSWGAQIQPRCRNKKGCCTIGSFTKGTQGLQTFYLEASVPVHPHLQYGHLTEVSRLGTQPALADSMEGRRHLPVGHPKLEGMNWNQPGQLGSTHLPQHRRWWPQLWVALPRAESRSCHWNPQLEDKSWKFSEREIFSCRVPGRS